MRRLRAFAQPVGAHLATHDHSIHVSLGYGDRVIDGINAGDNQVALANDPHVARREVECLNAFGRHDAGDAADLGEGVLALAIRGPALDGGALPADCRGRGPRRTAHATFSSAAGKSLGECTGSPATRSAGPCALDKASC